MHKITIEGRAKNRLKAANEEGLVESEPRRELTENEEIALVRARHAAKKREVA